MIEAGITNILAWLAVPAHSLGSVFWVSFLSATLLPLPSEPAVLGAIALHPDLFWAAVAVATVGNTLGGMLTWWMGYGAHRALEKAKHSSIELRALGWLKKLGPKACFFAWFPLLGDPLCAVAGWMRLPFWPCAAYMLVGKALRYWIYSASFLWFSI